MRVNKPSTNQFLVSELKQWIIYARKEVSRILQASFNSFLVFLPQKPPNLKEISIRKFDVSSRHQYDKLKEVVV